MKRTPRVLRFRRPGPTSDTYNDSIQWLGYSIDIAKKGMTFWKSGSEIDMFGSKRPKKHQDNQNLL